MFSGSCCNHLIAGLIASVIANVIAGDILYGTIAIPDFCYFSFKKWVKVDFNFSTGETTGYPPL